MGRVIFFIFCLCKVFFAGVFCVHAGSSEIPGVADFGCILDAEIPHEAAIARISVPDTVYQCVTRADLGDVAIFSEGGMLLPHSVKKPLYGYGEAPPPVKLPVFPVYRSRGGSGEISMHVETGKDGAVIDVRTSDGIGNTADNRQGEKTWAWLIDASSVDRKISGFSFELSGNSGNIFEITVEAGDDPAHWRRIAGPFTIADLDYGGHRLSINRIEIPPVSSRYFRIIWPEEAKGAVISSLTALFPKPGIGPEITWKEFRCIKTEKKSGRTVFEFDTEGLFPVEQIDIRMPAGSGLFHGVLMSRSDAMSEWKAVYRGSFYGLVINGRSLKSNAASISRVTDRFWKFEADQMTLHDGHETPVLAAGWVPHDIFFVPGSDRKFILAFGKNGLTPRADSIVDSIMVKISNSRPVDAVVIPAKNGEKKFSPPRKSLPVRKWLLWAVLVLGVGIVGVMAARLYRQMGNRS